MERRRAVLAAEAGAMRILFLVWLLSGLVLADSQGLSSQAAAAVDAEVKQFMQQHRLDGVGLGILTRGRISYVQGYGTIHRFAPTDLASVSKPLTALLTMKLVEEGKLELDAPVSRYLEVDLPPEVTLRTLLAHTSGLSHYGGRFSKAGIELKDFDASALEQATGSGYLYSSPGYLLLSWILEKVGEEDFITQLNTRLARPARASEFSSDERYGWRLGAGGVAASPETLTRIAYALLQRRILKRETFVEMWTKQVDIPGKDYSQALGFRVDDKGRVMHGGSHPSTHNYQRLVLYPDKGHGMVLLVAARERFSPGQMTTSLYKTLKAAGHKL